MAMNRKLDETELTRLIAGVCERLPSPESARLNAIEQSVLRARPRDAQESRRASRWYWWLLAALATATAAAASWWAGEFFVGSKFSSPPQNVAPVSPGIVEQKDDVSSTNSAPERKQDSPNAGPAEKGTAAPKTIYRKESF